MEGNPGNPTSEPASPQKKRRRRKAAIMLFCIVIAMFLWFLRALENNYSTQITHPVRFTNLPDDYIFVKPLPRRLTLEVEALGFSLLKHNWNFSKTPLTIDFRDIKPVMSRKQTALRDSLSLRPFISPFSEDLGDIKVTGIVPDILVLDMAPKNIVK